MSGRARSSSTDELVVDDERLQFSYRGVCGYGATFDYATRSGRAAAASVADCAASCVPGSREAVREPAPLSDPSCARSQRSLRAFRYP